MRWQWTASSATLYAMGDILNIPSTLSHKSRYLPNAWVVTHAHQLKRTNKMKFFKRVTNCSTD